MADDKDLEKIDSGQEQVAAEAPADASNDEVAADTSANDVETVTEQSEATDDSTVAESEAVEAGQQPAGTNIPDFRAGDVLRLGVRITEGEKVRTQYFEGMVLSRRGAGVNQTFTIRKIGAGGIAVERIFPLYSPSLVSFEVRRRGIVRRAKVYFLRDIVGSTANVIKERKVVRDRTQSKAAKAEKKAARLAKKTSDAPVKKAKKEKATRSAKRSANKSE